VNVDAPSHVLLTTLIPILPNLEVVCLDSCHLCMNFNTANWKKTSEAERTLRVIMHKFNKCDLSKPASAWGSIYTGKDAPEPTPRGVYLRNCMPSGSLPQKEAKAYLMGMDGELPWLSVTEFSEAIAAMISVYWETVDKQTPSPNKKLYHLLRCATDGPRAQWYFNNIRASRLLPKELLS
jgi:hypothetical protein